MHFTSLLRRARVAGTVALLGALESMATTFHADGQLFKFRGKLAVNRIKAEAGHLVLQMDKLLEGEPLSHTNEVIYLTQDFADAAKLLAIMDPASRTEMVNILRRQFAEAMEAHGDAGAVDRMEVEIERLCEARGLKHHYIPCGECGGCASGDVCSRTPFGNSSAAA